MSSQARRQEEWLSARETRVEAEKRLKAALTDAEIAKWTRAVAEATEHESAMEAAIRNEDAPEA